MEQINHDIALHELQEAKPITKVLDFDYPTRPKDGYTTEPDYDSVLIKLEKKQL